jgi:hypothetical protein
MWWLKEMGCKNVCVREAKYSDGRNLQCHTHMLQRFATVQPLLPPQPLSSNFVNVHLTLRTSQVSDRQDKTSLLKISTKNSQSTQHEKIRNPQVFFTEMYQGWGLGPLVRC